MPELESDPFFIPEETLRSVISDLQHRNTRPSLRIAEYLNGVQTVPPVESVAMIGLAIRDLGIIHPLTHDAIEPAWYTRPRGWAVNFIKQWLKELREIICGTGKKPKDLGPKSHAALTAIAIALMHAFHIDNATANGVAALILIALARATKRSFCKMTDAEVLEALNKL